MIVFELFDAEIPRLSFNGIEFANGSFSYTYSLRSADKSSFDFTPLSTSICGKSNFIPVDPSLLISPTAREWKIGRGQLNREDFSRLCLFTHDHCKRVVIGEECFAYFRTFTIDQWSELETLVIRQKSFMTVGSNLDNPDTEDGVFQITNCQVLKSIQIGDWSFSSYHFFKLRNLPSLQSIHVGAYCFYPSTVLPLNSSSD